MGPIDEVLHAADAQESPVYTYIAKEYLVN